MLKSCLLFAMMTSGLGQYCSGGPTSALDSNLGAVNLAGNKQTIANTVDCPGQLGTQDFTSQIADVSQGSTYTLQYTVTTCGGQYTRVSGAWIDFNNNEVFDESEQLAPFATTTNSPDVQSVSFTVPSDAANALVRMRVMVQERSTPTLQPCDQFGYGGVKDFGIQIGAGGAGAGGFGSTFLIIVFSTASVYMAAGMFLNYKKGNRGIEMVPNLSFWQELPDLVKVGCEVSARKTKEIIAKLQGKNSAGSDDFDEI